MDFTHDGQTRAQVEENALALSGDRLIKGLTFASNTGDTDTGTYNPPIAIENELSFTLVRVGNNYQVGFSYYIENTVTDESNLDYYFIIQVSVADSTNNSFL